MLLHPSIYYNGFAHFSFHGYSGMGVRILFDILDNFPDPKNVWRVLTIFLGVFNSEHKMLKSKQVKNKEVVYFADIDDNFVYIDKKIIASGEKYEGTVVYKGVVEKNPHEPTYVVFGDEKIRVSSIDSRLFKTLSEAEEFIESTFAYCQDECYGECI